MKPARTVPQQSRIKETTVPAPMGGLNSVSSLASMPKGDAVMLWNMLGQELGLRTRLGYYEHALGLTQGASVATTDPIRTVLPFNGSTTSASKLFVTNKYGIYDVTAGGATVGLPKIAFGTTTGDAGRGVCHTIVTAAGHFLAYTDEVNGYYLYKESTDTWTKVTTGAGALQITGLDPANAVFCTVWKHRLLLVERGTANVWYLDLDAIQGAATKLPLSGKFKAGGFLVGVWSWTGDGGAGVDDLLVGVSSGGDVVIYQGTDPSIPGAFNLKGVWSVGSVPSGRHITTDAGGDLLLATGVGLLPLSKLVTGMVAEDRTQYLTSKVASLFAGLVSSYGASEGWAMVVHPTDNSLMITIPNTSGTTEQLVMSMATKGWSRYTGLPLLACATFQGKLYFGTNDGRICINDGYVDAVTLAAPAVYTSVPFAGITAFDKLGSIKQKQVQMVRGNFTSDGMPPNYSVTARYRYDTTTPTGGAQVSRSGGALWDSALWDVATWPDVSNYAAEQRVTGTVGMGPEVALAFSGKASSRCVLIGFDVMFTEGGIL